MDIEADDVVELSSKAQRDWKTDVSETDDGNSFTHVEDSLAPPLDAHFVPHTQAGASLRAVLHVLQTLVIDSCRAAPKMRRCYRWVSARVFSPLVR